MFKRKILVILIVIFCVLGGCSPSVAEPQPRDVRIVIGLSHSEFNLIELDGDELKVTLFCSGWWRAFRDQEENIFDERLLDDFRTMFRWLPGNLEDRSPSIVREIIEKEVIELSPSQLNNVWRLIENVVDGEADRKFKLAPIVGHIDYVWAIVDGQTYWSLYTPIVDDASRANRERNQRNAQYLNRDLLLLTYELIELSPPSSIGSSWQR